MHNRVLIPLIHKVHFALCTFESGLIFSLWFYTQTTYWIQDPVASLSLYSVFYNTKKSFWFASPIRGTNQCIGPCANADEVIMAQTEVVVVIFQHVCYIDTQLLLLWVYIIWQPSSWKRQSSILVKDFQLSHRYMQGLTSLLL